MATFSFNFLDTSPLQMTAGAAVSQYRAVKMSGAKVIQSTAEGDTTVGIALEAAAADLDIIKVQVMGVAQVTAGAAITAGVEVETTTAGKVITAAGAASNSCGVALEAAGADGDVISVLLKTPNVKGPANS